MEQLTYDTLPPHSTLLREYNPDGSVTITSPAAEPTEHQRQKLHRASAIKAAIIMTVIIVLVFSALPFLIRIRFSAGLAWWIPPLCILFFCIALFIFIW